MLQEEIRGYESKIASLQQNLEKTKEELSRAKDEANEWKASYDSIQKEMQDRIAQSLSEREELQATLDDVTSTLESTLLASQEEYQTSLNALTSDYDTALSQSKKMISALRAALRKTRAETKMLSSSSEEDRVRAVNDVRQMMNNEVEKLRDALKILEGKGSEDLARQREEKEKLVKEIE
jgi:chromosome segregation ATPase